MIRTATQDDLTWMLDWAADEGWNPGLEDAYPFHGADPGGFFIAERDGTPAACISVVNHSQSFAFLGFYICRSDLRGQGIGLALWRHAIAHAGNRTIGLDGVAEQEANYARSGFVRVGATRRLEGPRSALGVPAEAVPVTPAHLPAMIDADRRAFGIGRPDFLKRWISGSETRRSVMQDRPDQSAAFATARLCRTGCKIGPVVASDAEVALSLAAAAAESLGAEQVTIDVPDDQPDLQARLLAAGFIETFTTARMYRGTVPSGDGTGQAVASLELG